MLRFALLLLVPAFISGGVVRRPGDWVGECDKPCPEGHQCWLQEVWCVLPPCKPIPVCVPDIKVHHLILNRALVGNANSYIDQVLVNVDELLKEQGYDPYPLPEKTESWEQQVGLITLTAVASVYDGYLKGLSSLRRVGDVTMEMFNNIIRVSADIGMDSLEAGYSLKAQFIGLGPKCSVSANILKPEISIKLDVPATGGNPTVTSFHITNLGTVHMDISCGPILDLFMKVIETFLNVISNLIKDILALVLEGKIKELIEAQVQQLAANLLD